MRPLKFLERLIVLLHPFRWVQCCAELPESEVLTAYCIRHIGHFGKCRTADGKQFDIERATE